ncbi:DUF4260 domain-containing protein [Halobacillus massiliensis]|uniref:DUF4260 domain-containing protein n=1 Tax=Halobacillus massiliensis TaxID=1926286 RepID=UPI0009E55CEF|nr:DUF4260 domain-containing protein [Halobacillus massiliensis]
MNKLFLHTEGLFVFAASLYFYANIGGSWWLFLILLFVPDLFMLGYIFNNRMGAIIYNIGHTYTLPVILTLFSMMVNADFLLSVSIIWTAHIGMDRMLGYGLKYPGSFKDTHLQRV